MGHKVYCPTCERIVELGRKTFSYKYDEIFLYLFFITLGLGISFYAILKYSKKPNTCPNCESFFDLKTLKPKEKLKKQ